MPTAPSTPDTSFSKTLLTRLANHDLEGSASGERGSSGWRNSEAHVGANSNAEEL
jgi:hypothetical protein